MRRSEREILRSFLTDRADEAEGTAWRRSERARRSGFAAHGPWRGASTAAPQTKIKEYSRSRANPLWIGSERKKEGKEKWKGKEKREKRERGRGGEGGRERGVLAGLGSSCFSLAGCFLRYSALLCTSLLPLPAEPLPTSPRPPASLSPSRKPSRLVLQLPAGPAGRGRAAAVCTHVATRSSFFMFLSFVMGRAPLFRGVHIQPFPICHIFRAGGQMCGLQRKISRMRSTGVNTVIALGGLIC